MVAVRISMVRVFDGRQGGVPPRLFVHLLLAVRST
jgi:hypothetical protein